MRSCPRCFAAAPDDSRFCPACGAPLPGAGPADADVTTPIDATTPLPRTTPADGAGASAPSSPSYPGAATERVRFLPGAIVAERYRIVGLLGRGGMGEVYRADDLKLGQPVALKFLPPGLDADPSRLDRFLNEVRTARAVTHPNVCRVYDIGEVDGTHFLSMEYVDGEDLASLLRRIGRLPPERAVTVARQICAGLAAAHEQGILHRDLKPANVMIDGRGRVRLTDFGLAGLAGTIGEGDALAGTPAYMAPEQIAGGPPTVRSDIFALGLVLHELFTGHRVYEAGSLAELRELHESSAPSAPSSLVEGLDPTVERALLRCLERNPQDRPVSVIAVSAALPGGDPLAAALAAGETPSPEMVAESGRRDAMRTGRALLLALAGLALFVAGARWAGTQSTFGFLPLDKKPEVRIDRARGILAELGYTEPAYAEPVDQAWGLLIWGSVLDEVAAADSTAARWEGLRDRPDAGSFWYRQAPHIIFPDPGSPPVFLRGEVSLTNPLPTTPGDVSIVLDLAGQLRRFEVQPRRLAARGPSPVDWAPLFAMANLDPERFTETEPRYMRFAAPDLRAAWVGTRAEQPGVELRVEAGASEGRPILFNVASSASLADLSDEPVPARPSLVAMLLGSATPGIVLLVALASIGMVRRNVARGRSDRRGAARFASFLFLTSTVTAVLGSHTMYTWEWASEIWPILAAGAFMAMIGWAMYSAAEPIGRQVWPTMFVSSSRLFSRTRIDWRDPLIGRSVLVALLAGALLLTLQFGVGRWIASLAAGAPLRPLSPPLSPLLDQRHAIANVLDQGWTIGMTAIRILALVVVRYFLKRQRISLVVTVLLWTFVMNGEAIDSLERFAFLLTGAVVLMVVLLRWGVVAAVLSEIVRGLGTTAASFPDWSAWHGQPAVMALTAAAALAVYGAWAATGGRPGARPAV